VGGGGGDGERGQAGAAATGRVAGGRAWAAVAEWGAWVAAAGERSRLGGNYHLICRVTHDIHQNARCGRTGGRKITGRESGWHGMVRLGYGILFHTQGIEYKYPIYIYVCQCGKKKQNVASLPTGAVGKGAFAEGFWQLCSATLGNIFPARVFPALPSVVAQGSRQRIFF
jgi:hypothetical protein